MSHEVYTVRSDALTRQCVWYRCHREYTVQGAQYLQRFLRGESPTAANGRYSLTRTTTTTHNSSSSSSKQKRTSTDSKQAAVASSSSGGNSGDSSDKWDALLASMCSPAQARCIAHIYAKP
jgi:hypothetical protein